MADGTALLVIDMQEAVLAGCAGVPGVVARINALLGRARRAGARSSSSSTRPPTTRR